MDRILHTRSPVITNAFSVDVEEYYHAIIFQEGTKGLAGCHLKSRVEESIDLILNLLSGLDVRATFIVLGEVTEAHPGMVRAIGKKGHEITCHSYLHKLVSRQSPQEFRSDVRRAKRILEDLTGVPVMGYRVPSYSIGPRQSWAYDVIVEEGYQYDSSCYPILHDRYGDHTAPRVSYEISCNRHGSLIEFPVGIARLFGVNLPIEDGGYFRLLPTD